jgi:hypothetical protein
MHSDVVSGPYAPCMTTATASQAGQAAPDVAGAAREAWHALGESAQVVDWEIVAKNLGIHAGDAIRAAVLVPRVAQIECVLDPTKSMREARQDFAALLNEGWMVSALVPISKMGAAHEALRGLDLHLQGWWTNTERRLRFSSPETP